MKNERLVRVVFYIVDDFRTPHILRKSHIGYLTESNYATAVKNNRPVFALDESDPLAKKFPKTMTI